MWQHLALALLATITLGACGNKGGLVFPPVPTTATAPTSPATASPTAAGTTTTPNAQTAKDSNTPGEPAR